MLSKQQKFGFRLDASPAIGTGHLMRCLTLAQELGKTGHKSIFITRGLSADLQKMVLQKGHGLYNFEMPDEAKPKPQSPYNEWLGVDFLTDAEDTAALLGEHSVNHLIVDHYGIDQHWERAVKSALPNKDCFILVIDDLANRPHDCDLLLDQSLGRKEEDYKGLVSSHTKLLLGAKYALLRPEFAEHKPQSLKRRNPTRLESILISMGGTDEQNISGKILDHLLSLDMDKKCEITVVLGTLAPHVEKLVAQASANPDRIKILQGISNMAELLSKTDIAIGAGGTSAWERAYMGVPSYVVLLAENQYMNAQELKKFGAALFVDKIEEIFTGSLSPDSPFVREELAKLSKNALSLAAGEKRQEVLKHLAGLCDA